VHDADADGCTVLHLSAANGHLSAVRKLLAYRSAEVPRKRTNEAPQSLDIRNKDGETPLFIAAAHGFADVVQCLLDANASATEPNRFGVTPLMAAAANGMIDAVRKLLAHEAGEEEKQKLLMRIDKSGETALLKSARRGHAKVVQMLLRATVDKSPASLKASLFASIAGDQEAAARILIAAGSDLSGAVGVAATGQVQCLKALLELARGDAPRLRREQIIGGLESAMNEAAEPNGHDAVALVLLSTCVEFKIDVNTHLPAAARGGRIDLVHALLTAGAVDSRANGKSTALHDACSLGMADVVRILLRSGLPPSAVDIVDANGATALCCAAGYHEEQWDLHGSFTVSPDNESARLECIKLLLEAQPANYIAKDGSSRALKLQHAHSALAMASLAGFSTIVDHLKKAFREEKLRISVRQKVSIRYANVGEGRLDCCSHGSPSHVCASLRSRRCTGSSWILRTFLTNS
jgi:ankyrin repeat protein